MLFERADTGGGLLFAEDFDLPRDADDRPDGVDATTGATTGATAEPPPGPSPGPPVATWADVEAARAQGRIGGLAEAATRDAALLSGALAAIAAELAASRAMQADMQEQAATATAHLLLAALAAALPDLCAAHAESEVAATIRAVLPALAYEPEVVVRVHPALAAAIRREIDTLAEDFAGRVTLQPVASLARGDVQLRWQYAQATRDTGRLCGDILAALLPKTRQAGPIAPETAAPQTAVPQTGVPQTAAPARAETETAAPETAEPETTEPGTTEPGTTQPGTTQPGTTQRISPHKAPTPRVPVAAQPRRETADVH